MEIGFQQSFGGRLGRSIDFGRVSKCSRRKNVVVSLIPTGGTTPCVIRVIGVGGGGGNAVNRMVGCVDDVEFWSVNTDSQALKSSLADNKCDIGEFLTRGLGAGGDPSMGRNAAEESKDSIMNAVSSSDLVFITAGMGGGTGSGAAPVVARLARDAGCLTVGVVTKPFSFEGRRRLKQANEAIDSLRQHVDTLIVVSNDKLLKIVPDDTPLTEAFLVADDVLRQGVVGISEIIVKPGLVNVDFADIRSVLENSGSALMGIGTGSGKKRAEDAAAAAINSPLLEFPVESAKGIVFNITGGPNMSLHEINSAAEVIYEAVDQDANIIFGAHVDDSLGDDMSITIVATGFPTSPSSQVINTETETGRYTVPTLENFKEAIPEVASDEFAAESPLRKRDRLANFFRNII
ncbi:hypothetical protein NDN08_006629 [Rhodosorus marinus]|uniref:Plastid division protein FtsZ n=1 Tax=Rhodosorus marinus TaxID=101924 RepID=A0AAV8UL79_9RHOD|nr:hypothetical protein NDN08_006629 [Rhodosorus marinus]